MLKIIELLKPRFSKHTVCIDNAVFRLHYRLTFIALFCLSVLVTARQFFGDPIYCLGKDKLPPKLLEIFCWIHTTFSMQDSWHKQVGSEVVYPGVDQRDKHQSGPVVYHAYYQWVALVLLLQALLMYMPRYFWKAMEAGRIKMLVLDLKSPVLADEVKSKSRTLLVNYLHYNWNHWNLLFAWYFLAEILNFVNVVGQMFLIDTFLGGHFTHYGSKVISFTEWDWDLRYDPMIQVFPRMTKCTFHYFGSSGDVQKIDVLCLLSLNVLNEKIYVFIWFWFKILALITSIAILYRGLSIAVPRLRAVALKIRARRVPPKIFDIVIKRCGFGDWMMLNFLGKNLDSLNFCDVLTDLAHKFESESGLL